MIPSEASFINDSSVTKSKDIEAYLNNFVNEVIFYNNNTLICDIVILKIISSLRCQEF